MRQSQARQLEGMEALYREMLLNALRKCADGSWGLFGQNDSVLPESAKLARHRRDQTADELLELGSKIELMRRSLGLDAFSLHGRLLQMRAPGDANTPGEPKLAKAWLKEIEADLNNLTLAAALQKLR
jgi:hypothetical protein